MEENGNVLECGVHGRSQRGLLERTMGSRTQIHCWIFPRDSNEPLEPLGAPGERWGEGGWRLLEGAG